MQWTRFGAVVCVLFLGGCTSGDRPVPMASTDIFLLEIDIGGERPSVGDLARITDRDGFDNQPAFNGDLLLYASHDGQQSDIRGYDPESGRSVALTQTAEREYSPAPLPGGAGFSVVRVEADGQRRLWRFDAGGGEPSLVIARPEPISYYAWGDPTTVAVYLPGERAELWLIDVTDGSHEVVARDVGKVVHRVPGERAISFVHKQGQGEWWITLLDLDSGQQRPLVRTVTESEYYAWTPEGELVMSQQSRLYWWLPDSDGLWIEIADLTEYGLEDISRLAVSPDGERLALVAAR